MTSRQQERVAWIDLAKACCIVLVVMLHVQAYSGVIDWQTAQPIHQF